MQLFKKRAYTLYYPEECFNCTPHNVTIGDQVWTGCNLSVTTYRNGNTIPQVTDPTAWAALTTGAWCHVNNDPANDAIYGKLYNWYAINDPRGLGPVGYHVPTVVERDALITYLGGQSVAGGKIKEVGTCHWLSPNVGATDETGFTAFGAGVRDYDGTYRDFNYIGWFWTSTGFNTTLANAFGASSAFDDLMAVGSLHDKKMGYSVRLIQDPVVGCVEITFYPPSLTIPEPEDPYWGLFHNVEYLDCEGDPHILMIPNGTTPVTVCVSEIVSDGGEGMTEISTINCLLPLDFYADVICSGEQVTYVTIDDITGGTGPYYPAMSTFPDEATALSNTSWNTTPNPGNVLVSYAETNFGYYWLAVKDSVGEIFAKRFYAECWDFFNADRTPITVSTQYFADENQVCKTLTTSQTLYQATRYPSMSTVGDVVFTTLTGSIRYDGTANDVTGFWRKYNATQILSGDNCSFPVNCVLCSQAVRIDENGIILEFGCCYDE